MKPVDPGSPAGRPERTGTTHLPSDLMLCAQRQLEDFAPYGVREAIAHLPRLKPALQT